MGHYDDPDYSALSEAKSIVDGMKKRAKKAGRNLRLCPYHQDSLGWDSCTDGFKRCQVEKARKAINPKPVRRR